MKMNLFRVAAVGCSLAIAATPINAAVITTYAFDEAGWSAAAGSVVLEDFADTALAGPLASITGSDVVISGGVLTDQLNDGVGITSTTFTFSSPIRAFGGEWDVSPQGFGGGIRFYVDFLGGGSQEVTVFPLSSTFPPGFFGFVSDTDIIQVRLALDSVLQTPGTEDYTLDNLRYSSVPEPGTLALLGLGLAGLAATRRRKK